MSEKLKGRFVWYDLMTTDPEAAGDFYTKVVGWGTAPWEGASQPYTMWMAGETSIGGVMNLPEEARSQGAPPHWMAYIAHPDTDAATSRAEEKGATVLAQPWDLPEVGRISVVSDPHGAVFAIFTPSGEMPEEGTGSQVGRFSWHELASNDDKEAFGFYSELFGWEEFEVMDMGPGGPYRIYGLGGTQMGGIYNRPAEMPWAGWLLYISVEDLEAACQRVTENGGQVLNGPMDVPDGDRVAQCMDPQGAMFALHARGAGA